MVRASASIFRRATNQPAIKIRRAYVKWEEILLMPAQVANDRVISPQAVIKSRNFSGNQTLLLGLIDGEKRLLE
jgi:hypothetical protein